MVDKAVAETHNSPGISFGAWMSRLNADIENLRSALRWFVERGRAERALHFFGALSGFWYRRDRPSEGRALLEELLMAPGASARTAARGRALTAGVWMVHQQDLEAAREYGRNAASILREVGDREGEAHAVWTLGYVAIAQGNHAIAREHAEQGLALMGEGGWPFLSCRALSAPGPGVLLPR
jgi:Tetratricopeptide repeat